MRHQNNNIKPALQTSRRASGRIITPAAAPAQVVVTGRASGRGRSPANEAV